MPATPAKCAIVTNGPAYANLSVYMGSKAAVRAFAQGLAVELETKEIRVNTVAPGFTDTPTLGVAGLSDKELHRWCLRVGCLTILKQR